MISEFRAVLVLGGRKEAVFREELFSACDEMELWRAVVSEHAMQSECGGQTWLTPPHIAEDLYVAGNLFL